MRDRYRERVCADKRTKTGWGTDCRPVFPTHYCLCRWACLCKSRRKDLAVKLQPDSLAPPAQASVSCSLVNSLNLIMMIGRAQSALALAAPSSACCVLLGSIPSRCPSRSKIATSHEDRLKIATSHEDRSKIATSHEDSSETKLVRLRRCRNRRPAWIDHDVNKQVGHYTVCVLSV